MKYFGYLLIIVGIGMIISAFPIFKSTLACYDGATERFDDIGFRKNSRGLSDEEVCIWRSEIIGQLDTCLYKTNMTQTAKFFSPYNMTVIAIIRPSLKDAKALKAEHNTNCEAYPETLF